MSKYTPGPWKVVFENNKLRVDSRRAYICEMVQYGMVEQKRDYYKHEETNARLISAAPELLELSKQVLDLHSKDILVSLRVSLRQAIAKAEVLDK